MNNIQLQAFRELFETMQTEPTNWQWIGPHMSQRMFGITKQRAEAYATRHGGKAEEMVQEDAMNREQAISEFAKLILKYGLQWKADVPREAYDKMREISGILSIDEKLEILRQGSAPQTKKR